MKKTILLLPLIFFVNILIAQNVININEITSISCANGSATYNIETDATSSFDYQVQNKVGSSWINTFPPQTCLSPPSFTLSLLATTYRILIISQATNPSTVLSTSAEFTVDQPLGIFSWAAPGVINVACNGGNSGSIQLFMSGGTPPYTYNWTSGHTTALITGLTAGTYNCTVTDVAGCSYSNNPILIPVTENTALSIAESQTNVNCWGGATGTATVNVTGGTGPGTYSYLWNDAGASTSATASGLVTGTYTCSVTDANGCLLNSSSVTITQPTASLTIQSTTPNDASCFGFSNGSIILTTNGGGTAPYIYNWTGQAPVSTSSSTNIYSGLAAGTYSCTVTDVNGCTVSSINIVIDQPLETVFSISATDVICNGDATGTATVAVASGVAGGYTYFWSLGGGTNAAATGLSAATYTCTITTPSNGCTVQGLVTVGQPSVIIITGTSTPTNCFGSSTGTATVSVTGGVAGYLYSWNTTPPQTTVTATGLNSANYICTVTDGNSCEQPSGPIFVNQPTPILITTFSTPLNCHNGSNATASVSVSGGTPFVGGPQYTYLWSPGGQTTSTINTLTTGTYTCDVTDANGCTVSSNSIIITNPTVIVFTESATDVICNGDATGTATVTVVGGGAPYTYLWNDAATQTGTTSLSTTANGLITGTYICNITDAYGCVVNSAPIFVGEPTPVVISITQTEVICNGDATGTATVSVSGGGGIYSYIWSDGQTTATASGLVSGLYFCNVLDIVNGCTVTSATILVNQYPPIVITPSHTDVSCNPGNDGTATVSVSGGTGPGTYTYFWSSGSSTTATAIGLSTGTYTCDVTDQNGCTITSAPIFVGQATAISFTQITSDVDCNGGSNGTATVSVSGGTGPGTYTYLWTPGNQTTATATLLSYGYYTCMITDGSGCIVNTGNILVGQPSNPLAVIESATDVSCYGGSNGTATVSVSGGTGPGTYTYAWSNTSITPVTISGLASGTYDCTVTDANGCTITSAPIVVGSPAQTIYTTSQTNVTCNGINDGSATINVSAGVFPYTYLWSQGSTTATAQNLFPGTYTCNIINADLCMISSSSVIIPNPTLIVITPSQTNVLCYGNSTGTATVSVSGGTGTGTYTYLWDDALAQTTSTAIGLSAGNYTCDVTDDFGNGCTVPSMTISITENAQTTFTTSYTDVTCNGASNGTATVSISGGVGPHSYIWSNGETTATSSGLNIGTYFCNITDGNLCPVTTLPITISELPPLVVTSLPATQASCFGGSTGTATVSVSGGTGPGTYSYSWSTNPPQITPTAIGLSAGNYICTITDLDLCIASSTTIVVGQATQILSITSSTDVSCNGGNNGTVTVIASGGTPGYTYSWSPGGSSTATATMLSAGTYTCTIKDANLCQVMSSATVVGQPLPLTVAINTTDVWCINQSNGTAQAIPSGGTGPYTYQWSTGTFPWTDQITGLSAGAYTVTVTDANCPAAAVSQICTILGPSAIVPIISITDALCYGGATGQILLSVSGGAGPYTYAWSNGTSANPAVGLVAGNYTCTITDFNGCDIPSGNIVVGEPTQIAYTAFTDSVDCFGDANGNATVTVTPGTGTGPYTYLWNYAGASTSATASGLVTGTYTCTITDFNSCILLSVPMLVSEPNPISILFTPTAVSCVGINDGFITTTVTGGTAAYTYLWSTTPAQTTANQSSASGVAAGTHMLTVSDYHGCSYPSVFISVGAPSPITATITTTNVLCNGDSTGQITATGVSGSAGSPFTYLWSNGVTTWFNSTLFAGSYNLTITDASGTCSSFIPGIAVTTSTLITCPLSWSNPTTSGAGDGTITASSASGGAGGYLYSWTGPGSFSSTSQVLTWLDEGLYTLTVTDAAGCTETFTVLLQDPNCNVTNTMTTIDPLCFGNLGSLTWVNSGGVQPYINYLVNSAGTVIVPSLPYNSPSTPFILPQGTDYTLIVTDADGCQTSSTVNWPTIPVVSINLLTITNAECFGDNTGTASVINSGGTTPLITNWFGQIPTSLYAGTYNVEVTDINGCTSGIIPYTIGQPAAPLSISGVVTTLASCAPGTDGTATITATGGTGLYTYLWNDLTIANPAINLVPGTYTCDVTDANGCPTISPSLPIIISASPSLSISVVTTPISCAGGSDGTLTASLVTGTATVTYQWFNSYNPLVPISSSNPVAALPNGAYNVVATDANGCTANWYGALVNPTSITSTLLATNVTSNGANDGTIITNTPSGGTGPYTYSWVGPGGFTSIDPNPTGLAPGTYILTITDIYGCTSPPLTAVINEPLCNVTITSVITQPNCFSGYGGITWTNAGGSGPYLNVITDLIPGGGVVFTSSSPSGSSPSGFLPLLDGNYLLQVTDAFGCIAIVSIIIRQPNPLVVSFTTTDVICYGDATGTLSVTATGGTVAGAYTIGYAGITPSAILQGTYGFTLTDDNGCQSIPASPISYTIGTAADIIPTITATDPSCNGGTDGSATVTVTGGAFPYSYFWQPSGNIAATETGLVAGTYYCNVTDVYGCPTDPVTASVTIGNPTSIAAAITQTNVTCYGANDGTATVTATGGTGSLGYLWSDGQTTLLATGLVAGTYTCTINDGPGCTTTLSVIITQPNEILPNLTLTDVTCAGLADGTATISPTGGSGFYIINWFDGSPGNTPFAPLAAGNWTLSIAELGNLGCNTGTLTFVIVMPTPLTLSSSFVDASCNGYSNGSATVIATGGTPYVSAGIAPYTYLWDDALAQTTATATGLGIGTYMCTVMDSNLCSNTITVTISSPAAIAANISTISASCNGGANGSATSSTTGGTGIYTYSWSGGSFIGTGATYSGLNSTTTYYVDITDNVGCTLLSIPVNIPATVATMISLFPSNYNGYNVQCYDSTNATIAITATGGIAPYLYSGDGITFTANSTLNNISAGSNSVYVMDNGGCIVSTSIIITEPTAIVPNITITNNVTCNGINDGELLSTPVGGIGSSYSYIWSNNATTNNIVGLSADTFSVIVSDISGCAGYDTVILTNTYTLTSIPTTTSVSCTGSSTGIAAITNINGGTSAYTYLWNNGTINAINIGLSAGTYWCTTTDASGCQITDVVTISQAANGLAITNAEITNVSCNGGSDGEIKLTVNGGTGGIYTYLWSNGQNTPNATSLSSGIYTVTVTDAASCTVYDTLIVTEPPAMTMSSITPIDITCFGQNDGIISAVVLGGTPGYTYLWSNNQIGDTITNLIQGTYYIDVIDSNGCILIDSAIINEPDHLISILSETNPLCHNDSNGIIDVLCKGGIPPYTATYVSISYTVADSNIVVNIPGLSAGTNTLYVTDANGCNNITDITLINPPELEANSLAEINPTCYDYADGVAEVTIIGGTAAYTYLWDDALAQTTAIAIELMSGNYNCTVTDVNGCTDTTSFTLNNPNEIEVFATIQDLLCFGTSEGSISVNVENTIGNYQIFWQGANDSIFIDNLTAGLYHVTIIDDNSCTKTDSILVNQNAEMVINYTVYPTSCKDIEDGIIEINNIYGGTPPYNVYKNSELHTEGTYNSATIDNLAASDNNIPYIITLLDDNNCEADSAIMIDYIGGYNCIDEPIIISPNYDGTNDDWQPVVDLDVDMEVSILNRWGELEYYYTGNSILFIWDGVPANGGELPSADYYYIIKFKNNSYPARTGALTLIR